MKKRNWWFVGVGTILVSIVISFVLVYQNPEVYHQKFTEHSYELPALDKLTMGDLVGKRDAMQTFRSTYDTINAISVGLYNDNRLNRCHVTVELTDLDTKKIVEKWKFNGKESPGTTYKKFQLKKPLSGTKGKQYAVRVYSDDASYGNALSVIGDHEAEYNDGTFYIGGSKVEGVMMVKITYANEKVIYYDNTVNVIRMGIMVWIYVSLVVLSIYGLVKGIKKIQHCFLEFQKKIAGIEKRSLCKYGVVFWGIVIGCIILTIVLEICISNDAGWNSYYFIWLLAFAMTGAGVYLLWKKGGVLKAEYVFLLIACITGVMFVMELPATTKGSWDDKVHYSKVHQISYIAHYKLTKADDAMNTFVYPITFERDQVRENMRELNASYYGKENVLEEGACSYSSVYNTVGYIPGAVAHKIGRALHLPYVMIFYMGKFANLFVYIAVIYHAIKRLRSGKWLLTTMALFPTLIYIASNYSYDYWVNAWTMYGFSYIFSVMEQEKKINITDFFKIWGSFFLGLGPKAIYFPFLMFAFFIPSKCFSSKKENRLFKIGTILVMFVIVSSFMTGFLINGPGSGDARGGSGVNATLQVQFILEHPLEYTKILLGYLFGDYLRISNSNDYTNFMYTLGYSIFGSVSMFLVLVTMHLDHPKKKIFNWKHRVIGGGILFGTVCLVATALYISYTTVGLQTIVGCQYRYLLPVLFPVFMLAGHYKITTKLCEYCNPNKMLPFYAGLQVIILYVSAFICFVGKYT